MDIWYGCTVLYEWTGGLHCITATNGLEAVEHVCFPPTLFSLTASSLSLSLSLDTYAVHGV
jgi:hypothetical protein